MLRNYLLIAYRNLLRHKLFSFINVSGLAIGMAACLLILHYVRYERSYDSFHEKKDNLYRVTFTSAPAGGEAVRSAQTFGALGPALREGFPEVKTVARMAPFFGHPIFSYQDKHFVEEDWMFADPGVLELFSFRLIRGNPATAFTKARQIVLTEKLARKYFGGEEPIGKTIRWRDLGVDWELEVSGVMADVPPNSHLSFQALMSFQTLTFLDVDRNWNWQNFYTYVELAPGASVKILETKGLLLLRQHRGQEANAESPAAESLHLQPLQDIHLHSQLQGEAAPNGNATMLYFLLVLAGLIMVIAWLNYINLSTAKYVERAKEVGVRKVTGATKSQLIRQFLLETFVFKLLSAGLAVTLAQLFLPAFRQLTGSSFPGLFTGQPEGWFVLMAFVVVGTVLAGFYPAFIMSAFQPVQMLKGKVGGPPRGGTVRQALVVVQFAASIFLLIGTAVVVGQISFMRNQELGLNLDQVLVVKGPSALASWQETFPKRQALFESELSKYPAVRSMATSDFVPGQPLRSNSISRFNSGHSGAKPFRVGLVDEGFVETYQLKLVAGQNFPAPYSGQTPVVLLNESAVRLLGFAGPEEAVQEKIQGLELAEAITAQIIGVVQDFHYTSLKEPIEPTVFFYFPTHYFTSLKVSPQQVASTLQQAEASFQRAYPENPFSAFFLEEAFNAQYEADERFGNIVGIASGLAVFIACLGLLGLSYFSIARRTKEIGVRKVLGASVATIAVLLSKDFARLVLLANLLAWPLAWWGVREWLQGYAARMEISPWIFALPSLLVLLIALLTVSGQTWRAARANPVESLRSE